MSKIGLFQIILCLFLTEIYCKDEIDIQRKYDACDCDTIDDGNYDTIENLNVPSGNAFLFCCAKNFLNGFDFNVSWSFQGADPDHESTFLRNNLDCYGQRISSMEVLPLDEGNYTCTVRGKDGSLNEKTITLLLQGTGSYRGKPSVHNYSGNVYTEIGRSVKLSCCFFMGNSTYKPDVFWKKTYVNKTTYLEVMAGDLPYVTKSSLVERNGVYFTELILSRITEAHIGNYSCQIVTYSDVVYRNISVFNQENPKKSVERRYEVLSSCVIIVLSVLFITSCLIYRWRMDICLKWRKFNYDKSDLTFQEYNHDVFIVSGPSAVNWVHTVLLNKLEEVWFYDCFIPDRDMLAGQECVKEICEKLRKSQRTIIVITECLLHSGWCNFMMNQAVQNTIANSSKVLAINLSDIISTSNYSAEAQNTMRVLNYIKKIKYPLDVLPHINTMVEPVDGVNLYLPLPTFTEDDEFAKAEEQEGSPSNSKDKQEAPKQRLLSTLSIPNLPYSKSTNHLSGPVLHTCSSLSDLEEKKDKENDWKTPKAQSQRAANMISGSSEFTDSESRWKIPEEVQDGKEEFQLHRGYKRNYVFDYEIPFPKCARKKLYSESSECPLSPCSNTLFFVDDATKWTSRRKTFKENFGNFVFGNPEDLFWKKLHLHLPTQSLKLRSPT